MLFQCSACLGLSCDQVQSTVNILVNIGQLKQCFSNFLAWRTCRNFSMHQEPVKYFSCTILVAKCNVFFYFLHLVFELIPETLTYSILVSINGYKWRIIIRFLVLITSADQWWMAPVHRPAL